MRVDIPLSFPPKNQKNVSTTTTFVSPDAKKPRFTVIFWVRHEVFPKVSTKIYDVSNRKKCNTPNKNRFTSTIFQFSTVSTASTNTTAGYLMLSWLCWFSYARTRATPSDKKPALPFCRPPRASRKTHASAKICQPLTHVTTYYF